MIRRSALAITFLGVVTLAGAGFRPRAQETRAPAPPPAGKPGAMPADEALARKVCSQCHEFPPPDVLPRKSWGTIGYEMAGLVIGGIGAPKGGPPPTVDFDVDRVIHYYESHAPLVLPSPEPWPAIESGPGRVRFARHPFRLAQGPAIPSIANVAFWPLEPNGPLRIVAADMGAGLVLEADPNRPEAGLFRLPRVPFPCHTQAVDLDRDGRIDLLVADLGDFAPGDHLKGSVVWLRRLADGSYRSYTLASGLPRVADVEAADFNGDGRLDLVVAAFGWHEVGGIYLFENRTTDWDHPVFVKRELDGRPGTIHVPVADLNGDGRPDFVALISQHYETVVAFLNDGKGGFRKEVIDQAPHPAWGSSGLSLVDLDGDGDLDVLVTNGDMLDDFLLKPYHSIRWLENRGRFPFVPHELVTLPGVHRARAVDLDGDGDLDIVACAFVQFSAEGSPPSAFANQPSLVWLEQTSPGTFVRHTLELAGHHVSLDVGDYNRDGRPDILVGNFRAQGSDMVEIWENLGKAR
jgi:VCBS repeat protein